MSISGLFVNYIILELCFEEEKPQGSLHTTTHQSLIVCKGSQAGVTPSNDSVHVSSSFWGEPRGSA